LDVLLFKGSCPRGEEHVSPASRTAAVVIPARLGSRRFPRKVLARDTGKYLVEHVWERVADCAAISRVIIATDSEEVLEACRSFGAEARMTSESHRSGTDRVAEVAKDLDEDIVINVQGDEPYISHEDLERLLGLFDVREDGLPKNARDVVMSTLVARRGDLEGFRDPNVVKAVIAEDGYALYFTRSPGPHADGQETGEFKEELSWWQHIGIYAYSREFLLRYATLRPTALEKRERLEQLRALEHGYSIRVGEAAGTHLGIDTAEEYERFVEEEKKRRGTVSA
jgi:3-deoxy-manno-octulosonate cytidylyltransferase (CMP-KDO synthetase)